MVELSKIDSFLLSQCLWFLLLSEHCPAFIVQETSCKQDDASKQVQKFFHFTLYAILYSLDTIFFNATMYTHYIYITSFYTLLYTLFYLHFILFFYIFFFSFLLQVAVMMSCPLSLPLPLLPPDLHADYPPVHIGIKVGFLIHRKRKRKHHNKDDNTIPREMQQFDSINLYCIYIRKFYSTSILLFLYFSHIYFTIH